MSKIHGNNDTKKTEYPGSIAVHNLKYEKRDTLVTRMIHRIW